MATDVAEPVVPDCRGDVRSGARSDADYPLRVLYCGGKCWRGSCPRFLRCAVCEGGLAERMRESEIFFWSAFIEMLDNGQHDLSDRLSEIACVVYFIWSGFGEMWGFSLKGGGTNSFLRVKEVGVVLRLW